MNEKEKKIALSLKQADCLMELGTIGSGNAVVALSKLTHLTMDMSLTGVNLIPFNELSNILGDPSIKVFGIFSNVKGKADLSIIQIYTKESIVSFINTICEKTEKISFDFADSINSLDDLNITAKDFILEIGNILAGSYCSALANLMKIALIPDVPNLEMDSISVIATNLIKKHSKIADSLVMINTKISLEEMSLNGILCFIPSMDTLDTLFELINV